MARPSLIGSRAEARAAAAVEAAVEQLDAAARAEVKADAFVQNFVAMSPAQVANYVDANVTDLASARAVLKKLAVMVLLLARREYR